MNKTLTNTTNPVNQVFAPHPQAIFQGSIPINFLTVGQIIRTSVIERIQSEENYATCHLESEATTVARFTCADCLCRLIYIGLFNRDSVRSFAVCPECQRGMEF